MDRKKVQKEFIIDAHHVDDRDKLRFDILLGLLTDANTSYTELYGMPIEELMKKGYTYVIQKEELILERPIYKGEKIVIYPFIEGISNTSIVRGALIKNKDENIIGSYTAIVKIINKKSREKVNIPEFIYKSYGICKALENEVPFERIPVINDSTSIEDFPVLISDLDINNHVTHSRYVKWALEKAPKEFLRSRTLKKVSIVFLKEVFYGETVTLTFKILEKEMGDLITIHQIKNSMGHSAAMIKCTWEVENQIE